MSLIGSLKKTFAAAALAAGTMMLATAAPAGPTPVVGAAAEISAGGTYSFPAGHPLAPQSAEPVDVRLVLVVDASGSMSPDEYRVQIEVTAQALTAKDVIDAWFGPAVFAPDSSQSLSTILSRTSGPIDSIAIAVVDFGDGAGLRVPWVDFRADDPHLKERLTLFAGEVRKLIENRNQSLDPNTLIGRMLTYVKDVYGHAPWRAELRDVVDVFSDGKNSGIDMAIPRQELARMGVTINALAIVNEVADLDTYYRENLATQPADIPPDMLGVVVPGRVWAVARNLQKEDNSNAVVTAFSRDVELAFRRKLVWETTMLDLGTVAPAATYSYSYQITPSR